MRALQLIMLILGLSFISACGDDASTSEPTPEEMAAQCGDHVCQDFEDASTCPSDCPAVCGDDFCTHDESPWDCPRDCKPTYVDVRFNYLLVGPVKADGCQWDGFSCSAPQEKELVDAISALGGGLITTAIALYNSGVFNALNKPDPRGWIENGADRYHIPATQDQFMAPFGPQTVFRTVPYNSSMFFTLYIEDEDLANHDLIWTGNLRFNQFEQAFLSQEDLWIDLRAQSQQQLVGINITVTPAQESTEFPPFR